MFVATVVGTAWVLALPEGASSDRTFPAVVGLAVAFVGLVLTEHRSAALPVPVVLGASGFLIVLAVTRPPLGSHDLWSYAMYGRIVSVHHANPYRFAPSHFPEDRFLSRVSDRWRDAPSVYGPGFTLLSALVASVVRGSTVLTRVAFQSLAGGAAFASAWLIRRRVPAAGLVAVALNPVVLVVAVNGGHNDTLIGLALVVAALTLSRRPILGSSAVAAAVLVKAIAIFPAVAIGVWVWRHRGLAAAARAAAVIGVPVVALSACFGGVRVLTPLRSAAGRESRVSPWRFVSLTARVADRPFHLHRAPLEIGAGVVVVSTALVLVRLHEPGVASLLVASLAGYLFAGGWILPWYLAWVLPVAALESGTWLARAIGAYSIAMLLAYQYHQVQPADALDHGLHAVVVAAQAFTLVVTLVLLVAAAAGIFRARPFGHSTRGHHSPTPEFPAAEAV